MSTRAPILDLLLRSSDPANVMTSSLIELLYCPPCVLCLLPSVYVREFAPPLDSHVHYYIFSFSLLCTHTRAHAHVHTHTHTISSGTFSSVYLAHLKENPDIQFALKHIVPTSAPCRIENELRCLQTFG